MRFVFILGRLFTSTLILAHFPMPLLKATQPENQQTKNDQNLRGKGNYLGLVVGVSRYADMVRILGIPQSRTKGESDSEYQFWYRYEAKGKIKGRLDVILNEKTNRIIGIDLYPDKCDLETAIKVFGKGFSDRNYDLCPSRDGLSLPYRSKFGQLRVISYEGKGITIHLDFYDQVQTISFSDRPYGLKSEKDCPKVDKK